MADLSVSLAGLRLRNPVVLAAGTCGYVREAADAFDLGRIGAVTTKSITAEPRDGNAPWRIIDSPAGMLNAIGLANVGIERFVAEKLPTAAGLPCALIGSVAGHSVDEYLKVAEAFDARGEIGAIELNVSCPNTADGLQFGEHPDALRALLGEIRPRVRRKPLIVKLSPNVGDVVAMAAAAIAGGAQALVVANTFSAMAIDVETRAFRLSRGRGGLSGPGIHPIVVRMVHDVWRGPAREAGVPIIGLGGVTNWRDAAEFILAGATAVGMGTALFIDPRSPVRVVDGLAKWVERQGCRTVTELVGAARSAP
ncbi:MAG: dihydroorotate dehydrogenase [Planctomycetaceae bacterium]|jgi:dihydroorotate dehydrogenase (NAD+) catalytic subunit|nr:dihydroorotate dehydrogenase [Planctomycetaceae bacterium]